MSWFVNALAPEDIAVSSFLISSRFLSLEEGHTHESVHALIPLIHLLHHCSGFKIVWITTWGAWKGATSDSLFKGLYGSQHVFDVEDHGGEMQDCYYLGFSDFRRYNEMDAVIIVDGESMQILVNEFSPRYELFMES